MAESASFEKLRQKRLRYVESARENDFEEGLKSLLSELYPDNAHFIYELLQNAEDALATNIEFSLQSDRLTVTHNGKRPFSLVDIESITGIGNSTKRDDPTQIGKFGVGFKAVFAYTTRPEVRSGEHAFAIADLFVPEVVSGTPKGSATTFTFPFDRADKPASVASEEVARGLSELDEKTLLFLTHINTITYNLPDGTVGIIERQSIDDRVIRINKSEGDDFVESHWLRLVGPATVDHEGTSPLTVAAAFRMEIDSKPKRTKLAGERDASSGPKRFVVPLDEGDVSIYFPAVKESSGLRFHIHAPFASTVARDSVRDDPGNVRLVDDIAALVVDALPGLRDQGLIQDNFLATLPNEDDQIGHPYSRIRDAITEAFNGLNITPVWGAGGAYATAVSLVSSPSEFRNWLDPSDLPTLFRLAEIETELPPRWIRDRDGRAGKFLGGLDTIEFEWDLLSTAIQAAVGADEVLADTEGVYDEDDKIAPQIWFSWIEGKSDELLVRLYQLLGFGYGNYELWSSLTEVPIVRLRKRRKPEHVRGPDTFLPSGRNDTVQTRVPVELSYFDDDEDQALASNLKAFYSAAGVKRWNESARIEARVGAYRSADRDIPAGDDHVKHVEDVRAFARYALANRQGARQLFSRIPFLLSADPDGHLEWHSPDQTFVDLPYEATGLSALYRREKLKWGDEEDEYEWQGAAKYPVAGIYLEVEEISNFLELVGSQTGVQVSKARVFQNPQIKTEYWVNNRHSSYTEMVDWEIRSLDSIIGTGDVDLLRNLWNTIVEAKADKANAVYRANASARRYVFESQLAQSLKASAWILDTNGDLKFPREVTVDDLPADWQQPAASSLVHKLDLGTDISQRHQKEEGVSDFLREEGLDEDGIDFLREAKELGISIGDLRDIARERAAMSRFPEGASDDPVRRAGVGAVDAILAPKHMTETRERSVVTDLGQASAESKAYLRGQYTNPAGEMYCQACRAPLPFKARDGFWYFEAVRFVNARKQVHTANAIALCPLCAALYKYTRDTKNEAILEQLASTTVDRGQGAVEVPVVLNGKRVRIGFTGKHAIDVKTALGVAGDERTDEG